MDFPTSSLQNQYIQKKNKFPFRFGFVILFIISVGLNVYLLYFDQKTDAVVASIPQDSGKISQNSVEPLQPEVYKRSEEHTSELQSRRNLVCRLLLEKKKTK